ncbi:restriction endonuclease subunit S [Bacteroides fragilis]|nr:restriction endonuclease subunit S [Bacteroides fragilis]MBA5655432.1 restriction endonuclease subunit S [Bacteroides fragilis]
MAIDNKDKKILNVPHLRFPEFSGEWEMVSLQDIATINPKSDPLQNTFIYIDLEAVEKGELRKIQEIMREEAPSRAQRVIDNNDILFQCVRPYQKNNYIHRILNTSNQQWVASTGYAQIRTTELPNYIYHLLNTDEFNRKVMVRCTGSSYPAINSEDLATIHLYYTPDKKEQLKISRLLDLLDKRIATQNKIIEDLKKLKSAIVEMLLCNQNGESFKLRDVGCFVRGLTYANEDVTENKAATTVIRANNLNYGNNVDKDEVVYVNKTPTTSQILRKGDIVICMANGSSSLVGKNSYYPFNDGQSTIGAFCGIYRTSYPFVKWLMQSQRYKRLVYQSLQGGNGAIANLNGDDILNMSFPLIENGKSQSIIFAIDAIEKSLMVNKSLQRLYYTQKSYLLKQMFI